MAAISRVSALALLAFAGVCSAVEKRDLKEVDATYDYIVVGGEGNEARPELIMVVKL